MVLFFRPSDLLTFMKSLVDLRWLARARTAPAC